MSGKCGNPYCYVKEPEMRPPTQEEYLLWEAEVNEKTRELLKKNEIKLMICRHCSIWTVERKDAKKQEVVRTFVASPFRFKVGTKLKVIYPGMRFNQVEKGFKKLSCRQAQDFCNLKLKNPLEFGPLNN